MPRFLRWDTLTHPLPTRQKPHIKVVLSPLKLRDISPSVVSGLVAKPFHAPSAPQDLHLIDHQEANNPDTPQPKIATPELTPLLKFQGLVEGHMLPRQTNEISGGKFYGGREILLVNEI